MRLTAQQPANSPPQPEPTAVAPVRSSITVIEKVTADTPASVAVMEKEQIQQIPGVNLDDRLRMIPGFSLFRRSSSLVAHPTTQGISLRGIGSSGVSRTLVLWDGIPLNDPFGGWIYWTRVSPEEISRAEVTRGASTSVFGDRALGGAISLFTREAQPLRFTGSYEAGNRNTHTLSAGASHLWRRIAVSGNGRAFTTNGYFIVPPPSRGPVDREAAVRFAAGDVRLDFPGAQQRLFFKADIVAEERANGTLLQRNSTGLGAISVNYAREFNRDTFSVLGYHTREEFHSSYSAIPANRRTETISFLKTVPSDATGGAAFWRRPAANWNLLVGGDALRVEGYSIDSFPTIRRVGGAVLGQYGGFFQADAKAGPARVYLGARHHYTGLQRQFFTPSAGFAVGRSRWRAHGSVYRSFRAPNLNELYSEFRLGNSVTLANAALKPERVFGAEAGFDWSGESRRLSFSFYRNDLRDLITNVTLRTTPAEITRQRRNSQQVLARGAEMDFRQRWRKWEADLGYLFVDSRFSTRFRVPQVAKHQGSAQFIWHASRALVSFGIRSTSFQFEDDVNRFLLPGFASAHFSARYRLWNNLSASAVLENLFDREYVVGYSPLALVGPPRLWRAGLRWDR